MESNVSFFVQYRSPTYSKHCDGKGLVKGWRADPASLEFLPVFFPLEHNGSKQRGNDMGEPHHPPLNICTKRKAQCALTQVFSQLHLTLPHIHILKEACIFYKISCNTGLTKV